MMLGLGLSISAPVEGATPSWVEDPDMLQIDFTQGRIWNPETRRAVTLESELTVSSPAGYAVNSLGQVQSYAANALRVTDRGLNLRSRSVTNLFASPLTPATQTITVTNGAGYWVRCWGPSAVIVLSGAATGTFYAEQPRFFTASGTSLTITVSGDCTFVQLETNNGDRPSMPTVGTQAAETISFPAAGLIRRWINAAATTVMVRAADERSPFGTFLGGAGNLRFTTDGVRSGVQIATSPTLTSAGNASVNSLFDIFNYAISADATGKSVSVAGVTAATDANARGDLTYIGRGVIADRDPSGLIRDIRIRRERVSDASLAVRSAFDYGLTRETVLYPSSIDPVTWPALQMKVAYDAGAVRRGPLPLLFLGHGTNGRDTDFTPEMIGRFAYNGFFVVVCDMRTTAGWVPANGYDASGRDSQGRMTMDVLDALRTVQARYGSLIDWTSRTYAGYSGAEALALAMKAPWAFDLIAAHFNIPDYEAHLAFGGTVQTAARTTGGYASRNAIVGVPKNRRSGGLLVRWDTGDTQVDPASQQALVDALTAAGRPFEFIKTQAGDAYRIVHGAPGSAGNVGGREFRDWMARVLAGTYVRGDPAPSATGFYVPGYVLLGDPLDPTTPQIMLGSGSTAGTQHAADLDYDLDANTFTVTPLNGSTPVTVTRGALTITQTISSQTTLTPV